MNYDLKKIFGAFNVAGRYISGRPFGTGHIHDTYKIITEGEDSDDYILQRINRTVFTNIPDLQRNIEVVTQHIRSKLADIPGSDPSRQCLTPVYTKEGKSWHTESDQSVWRMFVYIKNHRSYDIVDTEAKAFEGGRAIGRFVSMLSDLPGDSVAETIPGFHNIEKRLETFAESISADRAGRRSMVTGEIDEILRRSADMSHILRLGREGKIPLRITHNDSKFNNILLDENDKALCVIDLDTVMPGYVHYDFGDAIRTAACTAAEDETDLSAVALSLPLFEAWTKGFLGETRGILTPEEKRWLAFAPRLITYAQAVRFLTDYLDGDLYYKTRHREHNIERTRTQLKLLSSMELQSETMEKIVQQYC
jgi:Ser/Thr protein kinase RdoA (MazF antagonist)